MKEIEYSADEETGRQDRCICCDPDPCATSPASAVLGKIDILGAFDSLRGELEGLGEN